MENVTKPAIPLFEHLTKEEYQEAYKLLLDLRLRYPDQPDDQLLFAAVATQMGLVKIGAVVTEMVLTGRIDVRKITEMFE